MLGKIVKVSLGVACGLVLLNGCSSDAQVASRNLAKDAENFKIARRIVFMNAMADTYILSIQGFCSIEDMQHKVAITCKTEDGFKKHQMGLSETVTYFSEQIESAKVSTNFYTVIFKPTAIIPAIELR